jgi:hypothetical protein
MQQAGAAATRFSGRPPRDEALADALQQLALRCARKGRLDSQSTAAVNGFFLHAIELLRLYSGLDGYRWHFGQ